MDQLDVVTVDAESAAVTAMEEHHAAMAEQLAQRSEALVVAASEADVSAVEHARSLLADWCQEELVPHAAAEEETLYPLAHDHPAGQLLVDGMLAEHRVITTLVAELSAAGTPVRLAAAAHTLRVMFETHLAKENKLILPLLEAMPSVSLARTLAGMHELLGHDEHAAEAEGCGGHCHCADEPDTGYPVLDVRQIPHAIRHATIFGALDAVGPGQGLTLVAPHEPKPMLSELDRRSPGQFTVEYVETGPERWSLQLTRVAS